MRSLVALAYGHAADTIRSSDPDLAVQAPPKGHPRVRLRRQRECSGHPEAMQPLQVDREAYDAPLAARLRFAAETEAAKAEHGLDPTDDGFDNRFAPSVTGASRLARQSRRHSLCRLLCGFRGHIRLSLASQ